jgi:hypothetical protein
LHNQTVKIALGALLEGRIVANALRQLPNHFLSQELSLKALTSLKVLDTHALEKGLSVQDLEGFHQALVEAIQRGFDQAFGLAALLAGLGVVAALLVPLRLNAVSHVGEASSRAREGSVEA